ncbi:uncharacterized protein LOC118805028 [Colossoma macropomum]|uniref:uncharacterized protein LOC118805028 n=1 Tax=Colossoma macropomum TaxID=42526 RepID=UPI001863BDD2|nr:uncharacterized protein LOC118805028 [Colossoma macropomum]
MSQICSSDLLRKDSVTEVLVPLENGLCSINRIYDALIDAPVDSFSGQCSNFNYIREQIVQAQQNLEQSENAANTGLKFLDEKIEILTQQEGKLQREMSDAELTLGNLRTEQTSNVNLMKMSQGALEQARTNLNSTRRTLRRQEERRRNAAIVTGVGAGLFAVPLVGLIAGPVVVVAGIVELTQASHAVDAAEKEVSSCECQVETFRIKVSEYESKISQTEHNIKQQHAKMEQIRKEIQEGKKQRASVAEFQEKVRRAVRVLSGLSGKASVAEVQTRRFILQESVMKVMEDLIKAAGEITGNQPLCNERIPRLIDVMRENNRKLAAICDSLNIVEDKSYY